MTRDSLVVTSIAVVLVLLRTRATGKPAWAISVILDLLIAPCIALLLLLAVQTITPPMYVESVFGRLGIYGFYCIVAFAGCGPIGWLTWRASRQLRAAGLQGPSIVVLIGTIVAFATPFAMWLHLFYEMDQGK